MSAKTIKLDSPVTETLCSSPLTDKQNQGEHQFSGTVSQMTNRLWKYRIYIKDPQNVAAPAKEISKFNFKGKKDALIAMNAKLTELDRKFTIADHKHSLERVFEEYNEERKASGEAAATGYRRTSCFKVHIIPGLGQIPLAAIRPEDIDVFLDSRREILKQEAIRALRINLSCFFQFAIERGYCMSNPVLKSKVVPSPRAYGEIVVYAEEELEWMLTRFQSTNLFTAFYLSLRVGLMPNEIFALRAKDIDFVHNCICIDKQLLALKDRWALFPLNKDCNARTVYFDNTVKQYLKKCVERNEEKTKLAPRYANRVFDYTVSCADETPIQITDFLNVREDGVMLNVNSPKVLSRIAKEEMEIDLRFQFLRYTYATRLADGGINPKLLQEQLGLGKLALALRFYKESTAFSQEEKSLLFSDTK